MVHLTWEKPSDWPERRKRALARDDDTCQNCGSKGGSDGDATIQVHHIVPVRSGGTHQLSNLVSLCYRCHELADRQTQLIAPGFLLIPEHDTGSSEHQAYDRVMDSRIDTRREEITGWFFVPEADIDAWIDDVLSEQDSEDVGKWSIIETKEVEKLGRKGG